MALAEAFYNSVVAGRVGLAFQFEQTMPFGGAGRIRVGGSDISNFARVPRIGVIDLAEFQLINPGGGGATIIQPTFYYKVVGTNPFDTIGGATAPGVFVSVSGLRYTTRPYDPANKEVWIGLGTDAALVAGQTIRGVVTIFEQPDDGDGSDGAVASDAAPIVIPAPVALTGAFVASDPIYVAGWHEVDWAMLISNAGLGPVTRADVQFEFAETVVPVAADWTALQTEAIVAGVSTPSTYEVRQPIGGAVPYTKAWTTQVRGLWMRILVQAGVGDPTGSVIALSALRRV